MLDRRLKKGFSMMQGVVFKVLMFFIWAPLAMASEKVPVIALDGSGKPIVVEVSAKEYSLRYKSTVSTTNDSLMEALDITPAKNRQWHLRTITVGLGVNMEFGVGPFKVAAVPKSRLFFTNSTNPPLP